MKALFKFPTNDNTFQTLVDHVKEVYGEVTDVEEFNGDKYGIIFNDDSTIRVFDLSSEVIIDTVNFTVLLSGSRGSLTQSRTSEVTRYLELLWDKNEIYDYDYVQTLTPELHPWETNQTGEDGTRPIAESVVAERLSRLVKLAACCYLGDADTYRWVVEDLVWEEVKQVEENRHEAVGPWDYLDGWGMLPPFHEVFEIMSDGTLGMLRSDSTRGELLRALHPELKPTISKQWVYQQLTKNM